jgi:hypothetical protein
LQKLLGISPMTVYNWRRRAFDPLPHRADPMEGGKHRVSFLVPEASAWLARNRPALVHKITAVYPGVHP